MMIKLYVLTVLTVFINQVAAQQRVWSGWVSDATTGEPLRGCSLLLLPAGAVAVTDQQGRFTICIPAVGGGRIVVSFAGYKTDTISIVGDSASVYLSMTRLPGLLNEVVVTGVARATLIRENPVAIAAVTSVHIDRALETNLVDALVKNVPGLTAVKTGPNISKPFIRGLGYNRVLTLYDGVRQEGQQWGDEHGLEADAYNIEKGRSDQGPSQSDVWFRCTCGRAESVPFHSKTN